MKYKFGFCIFIFSLICFNEINGQVLSSALKKEKFEIGCIYKFFHRKVDQIFLTESQWGYGSIFMKYGLNQRITLSGEGVIYDFPDVRFPDRDERIYIFGLGTICNIIQIRNYDFILHFHYCEFLIFTWSPETYGVPVHSSVHSITGGVQIQHSFSLSKQRVTLIVGPSYIYDKVILYYNRVNTPPSYKSINNLGIIMGSNFLMFKHVELSFHIVYADFFQPRVGIGYQF